MDKYNSIVEYYKKTLSPNHNENKIVAAEGGFNKIYRYLCYGGTSIKNVGIYTANTTASVGMYTANTTASIYRTSKDTASKIYNSERTKAVVPLVKNVIYYSIKDLIPFGIGSILLQAVHETRKELKEDGKNN